MGIVEKKEASRLLVELDGLISQFFEQEILNRAQIVSFYDAAIIKIESNLSRLLELNKKYDLESALTKWLDDALYLINEKLSDKCRIIYANRNYLVDKIPLYSYRKLIAKEWAYLFDAFKEFAAELNINTNLPDKEIIESMYLFFSIDTFTFDYDTLKTLSKQIDVSNRGALQGFYDHQEYIQEMIANEDIYEVPAFKFKNNDIGKAGLKILSNSNFSPANYCITIEKITALYNLFIEKQIIDPMSLPDFINCFDLNIDKPALIPNYAKGKHGVYVGTLKKIEAITEKIALSHFGVKNYRGYTSKPNFIGYPELDQLITALLKKQTLTVTHK